ncbi:MAG: T9SS type A sorting domain-containing protein, partial [Bacteroidota bacterium]
NFEGAGPGTCLIWYLRYDGEITGLQMGANANNLEGCFSLSNEIEVIRTAEGDCQANGGELFGGPFEFTVGDGIADMLDPGAITLANSQGSSQWIVTDDNGVILGLPPMPSAVDFDDAGVGLCLVWHLSFEGEVEGLEVDANIDNITGCISLSNNAVEVIRTSTTSTSETESVDFINVYPNPATDLILVEYRGLEANRGQLQLFDIAGRQVQQLSLAQGDDTIQLDVSNLPSGYFLLRIESEGKVSTKKVIVSN